MLVPLISNKAISGHSTASSGKQTRADELALFGVQAMTCLLGKLTE
jgi:hypothetical protein